MVATIRQKFKAKEKQDFEINLKNLDIGPETDPQGNTNPNITRYSEQVLDILTCSENNDVGNVTEAIKRLATADGIETKGLIRSEEDLQAEQQAQQQSMMDEQQQSAMLRAGEKIAGNIPPKTLGETIVNQS